MQLRLSSVCLGQVLQLACFRQQCSVISAYSHRACCLFKTCHTSWYLIMQRIAASSAAGSRPSEYAAGLSKVQQNQREVRTDAASPVAFTLFYSWCCFDAFLVPYPVPRGMSSVRHPWPQCQYIDADLVHAGMYLVQGHDFGGSNPFVHHAPA